MTSERRHRVGAVFAATLRCTAADREVLLGKVCAHDADLRAEAVPLLVNGYRGRRAE
jgi:hypothetical protein